MQSFFRYFFPILSGLLFRMSLLCLLLIYTSATYGQDIQLSLYEYHPLFVNAAYTGSFDGDWRLSAGYRNQQVATAQSYTTAIAGFDGHVYLRNQKIGAGLYVINDQSGIGGLTFNKIYGSLAYEKDIQNNIFGIGLQGGFISGSVNDWGTWDNVNGTFTAPSGELYFGQKTSYFDINLGISWRRKINHILPQAGISILHLNQPNISFIEGEGEQNIQMLADIRIDLEVGDKLVLTPLVLFNTLSGINQSVAGANISYLLNGKRNPVKAVFGGVHLQNGILENASSLMLQIGARITRIDIVLGYERNLGKFSETTGSTGAFEVAVVYKSISTVLNTYSIPCERY